MNQIAVRSHVVGVLRANEFFGEYLLGLAAGAFLNLKVKRGETGDKGALRNSP